MDESVCKLLPVGCLEDKLLEGFLVLVLDCLTTFDLVGFKTILGLQEGILDDKLAGLEEIVESHGTILFVLRFTKLFAFCNEFVNDFFGWLCFLKFRLFFGFFLRNYNLTETLEFLIFIKIVMLRSFCQMRQIKSEFNGQCIGCLTHFNGLDFSLSLWARSEFKTLELTEHIHVTLELELGGLDNIFLALSDVFSLKCHAHFTVLLLNFSSFFLVLILFTY